ncbi:hypothetical protein [uncultured Cohaesibacter sp.]|uniref:hypothetical protein n=1 Tax=uncultured Cohaesibacter sp. TaxID=1002546 RepID=UPI0029C621F3|nr:hypothetical protein [uncultured Cohaesibacter sp.]
MKKAYTKSALLAALVAGVTIAAPLSMAQAASKSAEDQIVRQADDSIFVVDYVLASQKDGAKQAVSTEKAVVKHLGTSRDDDSQFIVDYVVASQKAGAKQPVSTEKAAVKHLGTSRDDDSPFVVDYVLGKNS